MSEEYQRIELITGTTRRRHWSTEEKLRILEESFEPGESVSSVARRNGVAPNLLYRWRRLMSEGGVTAVGSDEPVVGNSEVRKLEDRVRVGSACLVARPWTTRSCERRWLRHRQKNRCCGRCRCRKRFPMKRVAEAIGVSRSNLVERAKGMTRLRGPYLKAEDAVLLPIIRSFVDERQTYGYRRITALVNRELASRGLSGANRKRVHRIMQRHALLLERHTGRREGRIHDGKVMVMRSNLRWCSDGLEFSCWNGEVIPWPSSSMPSIARSSPGRRSQLPVSAAPRCAI